MKGLGMSINAKKQMIKDRVAAECGDDLVKRTKIHALIDKMEESNIPIGYWFLTMDKFDGSPKLKEITDTYISNMRANYMEGHSICLAGSQGTGKTMSSICILKAALKQGFSTYYTTASDILHDMTDYKNNGTIRNTLRTTDFLVIDELDSRFFVSDSVKELFSGIYENVFRYRAHNTLPSIICTNETEGILSVFYGAGRQSIDSLNQQYLKIYPVVGKDFRKQQVENVRET
jgi:DNA replication protein DnaC